MSKRNKVFDKILHFLGFEHQEDRTATEYEYQEDEVNNIGTKNPHKAPIVGLPKAKQIKIIILEPTSFDDVKGISDHLKERKQVVINLEKTEKNTAQRILDFLSGVTYALNGNMQKVGQSIFLFTPSNTVITGDNKKEVSKIINLNWAKGE